MTPQNPIDDDRLAALPVQDGLDALLRELVPTIAPAAPVGPPHRRRWSLVVASAASVALVAAASAYLGHGAEPRPAAPPAARPPGASSTPDPSEPADGPTTSAVPRTGIPTVPARVVAAAWAGPASYAVLDAPGWAVEEDSVSTASSYGVQLTYVSGGQRLELGWVREEWFMRDVRDARQEPTASTLEVLGQQATYVTYESQQQMAYLPVHDGYGLRVAGSFTTSATFEALVDELRPVDEDGFAAALPVGTVTPATSRRVAEQMLADSEAPDLTVVHAPAGFNARYHAAAAVVSRIGCAWVQLWATGDAGERAEAERALAGSSAWAPIVDDLRQPRWFAPTVAAMRRDRPVAQVAGSQGCRGIESP